MAVSPGGKRIAALSSGVFCIFDFETGEQLASLDADPSALSDTLDRLCEFIIESFDFIHEHLYEFCMDNKMYSEDSYVYDPDDDGPDTDIAIDKTGLV